MKDVLSRNEALAEAKRCLSCPTPNCVKGCPAKIQIKDFIKALKDEDLQAASNIIFKNSNLPQICSIVCPHDDQCRGHCILNKFGRPIDVGALERYVVENSSRQFLRDGNLNHKVAIVGAGPAGIACALELARDCKVHIYEASDYFGGLLLTGIPNYRLAYSKVLELEKTVKNAEVEIYYKQNFNFKEIIELKKSYDALFIGVGLSAVKSLGIKNEQISGVHNALEFLKSYNLYEKCQVGKMPVIQKTVVVIGAGNVAVDAARCAKRLGAEVIVSYRRSRFEAPASKEEIEQAEKEGVIFKFLTNPVEVIGQERVTGVKVEIMTLGEVDLSGRRRPIGTKQYEVIACDDVISAIGQNPAASLCNTSQLATDCGYLVCDELGRTNVKGIYAGGDIVLGAATVVKAMVGGKCAAQTILKDLR